MTLAVGLFVDGRNPQGWGRPWREHYPRLLDTIVEAEAHGADSVWLTEHHSFEDGYLPQPLVLAAAVAARTNSIRIGTAVLIATLRHPAHVVEEAAVVDLLSGGRLELGLGSGYVPPDFDLFGRPHSSRIADFDSSVAAIRDLLASPDIMPKPLQDPLPIWLGYTQPAGARKAGRAGLGLLSYQRANAAAYIQGLAEAGHDPAAARLGGSIGAVVADDPEAAWVRVRPYFRHQLNTYLAAAGRPLLTEEDLGDRLGRGRPPTVLDMRVMTVEETIAAVRRRIDGLPMTHIFTWSTLAEMPEDLAARHRELWLGPVRDALVGGH